MCHRLTYCHSHQVDAEAFGDVFLELATQRVPRLESHGITDGPRLRIEMKEHLPDGDYLAVSCVLFHTPVDAVAHEPALGNRLHVGCEVA